jgi:6-phosphofructokinase 2
MRTDGERVCPGGGGINVARVLARLGDEAKCYHMAGGAMGVAFEGLIDQQGLDAVRIPVADETRVALAVYERSTGKEYRFTPRGPKVTESEWRDCLDRIAEADCRYFVASGSLPPGVPDDFYARVAAIMRERGIAMVLDTSGRALREGLVGGIALVKPSLGELRDLIGRNVETPHEIADAASALVRAGRAELVAVTMGEDGALLASRDGTVHLPAIPIEANSAVGAGDSFVAGMVHALSEGKEPEEAFRFGMAAGAAAVLTPGTALALREDIERLYAFEKTVRASPE